MFYINKKHVTVYLNKNIHVYNVVLFGVYISAFKNNRGVMTVKAGFVNN